jgi:hypothetical protein
MVRRSRSPDAADDLRDGDPSDHMSWPGSTSGIKYVPLSSALRRGSDLNAGGWLARAMRAVGERRASCGHEHQRGQLTEQNAFLRAEKHRATIVGSRPTIVSAGIYLYSSPDSNQCLRFCANGRVISCVAERVQQRAHELVPSAARGDLSEQVLNGRSGRLVDHDKRERHGRVQRDRRLASAYPTATTLRDWTSSDRARVQRLTRRPSRCRRSAARGFLPRSARAAQKSLRGFGQ